MTFNRNTISYRIETMFFDLAFKGCHQFFFIIPTHINLTDHISLLFIINKNHTFHLCNIVNISLFVSLSSNIVLIFASNFSSLWNFLLSSPVKLLFYHFLQYPPLPCSINNLTEILLYFAFLSKEITQY